MYVLTTERISIMGARYVGVCVLVWRCWVGTVYGQFRVLAAGLLKKTKKSRKIVYWRVKMSKILFR